MSDEKEPKAPEQAFRDDLESVIAVLEALAPDCDSADDLVEVLRLALRNDGQLRLLMKKVMPLSRR